MKKNQISHFLPNLQGKSFPLPLLYVLVLLLGITCGYVAFFIVNQGQGADPMETEQEAPLPKTVAKQPMQPPVKQSVPVDIAGIYPFILPDGSAGGTAITGAAGIRQTAAPMSGSPALPAIPNYQPKPGGLPLPSLPAIPGSGPVIASNSSMQISASPHPTEIQGIFTGSSGSNMAILSDGKIVKEGDAYGDSRIAVIGGDGIQLDNGNSISYGIGIRRGE